MRKQTSVFCLMFSPVYGGIEQRFHPYFIQFDYSPKKKNVVFYKGKMFALPGRFLRFDKARPLVSEKYVLFDEKGLQFPPRNGII